MLPDTHAGVTLTLMVLVAEVPSVPDQLTVIELPVELPTIVPLPVPVIDHAYVCPDMAGTEYTTPVCAAPTPAGPLMTGVDTDSPTATFSHAVPL